MVFPSATPFITEENCTVPPAGTVDTVGFVKNPGAAPIVTTAVLDVTVAGLDVVVVVLVVVELVLLCCATAVMFTVPLFVDGTTAGAV
jgi:hypothetical protein